MGDKKFRLPGCLGKQISQIEIDPISTKAIDLPLPEGRLVAFLSGGVPRSGSQPLEWARVQLTPGSSSVVDCQPSPGGAGLCCPLPGGNGPPRRGPPELLG